MWGKLTAAVRRVKRASSNIGSAGARKVSAVADLVKQAPDAVRNLRQTWTERPKSQDFLITPVHLPGKNRSKARVYLISIALTFLVASLVTALGVWIAEQFSRHSLSGMLFAPVIIIAVGAAFYVLWREIRSWRRLIVVEKIRVDLATAANHREFRSALKRLGTAVGDPHRGRIIDIIGRMDAVSSVSTLRDSFDHEVVHQMDGYAVGAIHRAIRDMFFLSLVSPTDLTDTMAFVARATGMIRGIAFAYGQRPGKLGLIRLIRHVVADVALLSVTMIVMARATKSVGDSVSQGLDHAGDVAMGTGTMTGLPHVGVPVGLALKGAGKVLGAAGAVADDIVDAAVAAARMAQLGLVAVSVVRPIDLSDDRRKSMRQDLRKAIIRMYRETTRNRRDLVEQTEASEEAEEAAAK